MAINWSDEELSASVDSYVQMLRWDSEQKPYNKSAIYRQLAATFTRTSKSFEFRMQNISYVLLIMGRQWLNGLKPASNVGPRNTPKLLKYLKLALRENDALAPKLSERALLLAVNGIKKNGRIPSPFSNGIEPEDLEWTDETEKVWSQASQVSESIAKDTGAPSGVAVPRQVQTITQSFVRDAAVISWVLLRADGTCECCNSIAPFLDKEKLPFLEVHHLRRLADGGSDRPSNAVAVCPNCHRRLHFGIDSSLQLEKIYNRIPELVRE